jgi:S1-C subfamily serine protease
VSNDKPWDKRVRRDVRRTGSGDRPTSAAKEVHGSGVTVPRAPSPPRPAPTVPRNAAPPPASSTPSEHNPRNRILAVLVGCLVSVVLLGLVIAGGGGERTVLDSATTTPGSDSVPPKADSVGAWEDIARSVVYIEAEGPQCGWAGSGSLVLDGSYVLTNHHVSGDGECELTVFLTESTKSLMPEPFGALVLLTDPGEDLAILRIVDAAGQPVVAPGRKPLQIDTREPALGSKIFVLGFPAAGGETITYSSGDYSGYDESEGDFYKTTAFMNSGVSGGAAFNERGELIGVPTAVVVDADTDERLGINLIKPISFAVPLLNRAPSVVLQDVNLGPEADGGGADGVDALSDMDPIFDTCRDAKARGYGPYRSDRDPEYDFYDDRDRDGIVCE